MQVLPGNDDGINVDERYREIAVMNHNENEITPELLDVLLQVSNSLHLIPIFKKCIALTNTTLPGISVCCCLCL